MNNRIAQGVGSAIPRWLAQTLEGQRDLLSAQCASRWVSRRSALPLSPSPMALISLMICSVDALKVVRNRPEDGLQRSISHTFNRLRYGPGDAPGHPVQRLCASAEATPSDRRPRGCPRILEGTRGRRDSVGRTTGARSGDQDRVALALDPTGKFRQGVP